MLDEIAHEIKMPFAYRQVQRRGVIVLASEQGRALLGQLLHPSEIAFLASRKHAPYSSCRGNDPLVKMHGAGQLQVVRLEQLLSGFLA